MMYAGYLPPSSALDTFGATVCVVAVIVGRAPGRERRAPRRLQRGRVERAAGCEP